MHAWIRLETPRETLTLKAGQYKQTDTTSLNIPSSPDPFPLGLHALPLRLLNRACTQTGLKSSLKRRVALAEHTFIYASLINESSTAPEVVDDGALYKFTFYLLTYLHSTYALGQPVWQASALTYERGHVSPQIVNCEAT